MRIGFFHFRFGIECIGSICVAVAFLVITSLPANTYGQENVDQLSITAAGYYPNDQLLSETLLLSHDGDEVTWDGILFYERIRGGAALPKREFMEFASDLRSDLLALVKNRESARNPVRTIDPGVVIFELRSKGKPVWVMSAECDVFLQQMDSSKKHKDLLLEIVKSRNRGPGLIGSYLLSFLQADERSTGWNVGQ